MGGAQGSRTFIQEPQELKPAGHGRLFSNNSQEMAQVKGWAINNSALVSSAMPHY